MKTSCDLYWKLICNRKFYPQIGSPRSEGKYVLYSVQFLFLTQVHQDWLRKPEIYHSAEGVSHFSQTSSLNEKPARLWRVFEHIMFSVSPVLTCNMGTVCRVCGGNLWTYGRPLRYAWLVYVWWGPHYLLYDLFLRSCCLLSMVST